MNRHVVLATLRERLAHPIRLATLLGLFLLPFPIALTESDPARVFHFFHGLLAVTVGAGIIGQEISAGTLALAFTRPIGRARYGLSKWGAIAALTALTSLTQEGLLAAVTQLRFGGVGIDALAMEAAERILVAASVSALLLLLSSAGSGLSDLAIWGLGTIAAQVAYGAGLASHEPFWCRLGENLQFLLAPGYDLLDRVRRGEAVWGAVAIALVITVAALGLALYVIQRREITYAQMKA